MPQTSPLLISTHSPGFQVFSSPSAVTSVTHTPVLKGFRKRRFAVFWFTQAGRSPANAAFKNKERGELLRQKATFSNQQKHTPRKTFPPKEALPQLAEFYNKRGLACWAKSNGYPSPGSPCHLPFNKASCSAVEAPLSSNFRNPAFACGDLPIGCAQKTGPL